MIAVNNEGKELNEYRIREFKLHELFDAFASSCYMKLRKPDADIFRMACDIAQVHPAQAAMFDDRMMFVEVARTIGLHCIHVTDLANLKEQVKELHFK